jgi:hypothetical protein
MGRPTSLTALVHQAAEDYILNYKDLGDVVPQVAGMAKACGVCEKTIYTWAKVDKQFLQTLDDLRSEQHRVLVNGGLNSTFNAAISKLMLHNHGHSDKTDVTSGGEKIRNDWHVHPVTTNGKD